MTYLPADPEQHVVGHFGPGDADQRQRGWNVVLSLVMAAGGLCLLGLGLHVSGQRRLLEQGVAVAADVDQSVDQSAVVDGSRYRITYRYRSAAGRTAIERSYVPQEAFRALPEGSRFTVLRGADGEPVAPYFALRFVEIPGAAGPRLPL